MGSLNLVVGPFPNQISCQLAVGRLISKYPSLRTKLAIRQYMQVVDMILNRQADLGIAELSPISGNLELATESLGHHVGGFFCRPSHPLLGEKNLTIVDIVKYPWCYTKMPPRIRDNLPSDLGLAGRIDPETLEFIPAIEIETMFGLMPLTIGSDSLCPSALVMLKEELKEGNLAILPFHDTWMVTNYGFISLRNRQIPPAAKKFMDEVRRIEKELFL